MEVCDQDAKWVLVGGGKGVFYVCGSNSIEGKWNGGRRTKMNYRDQEEGATIIL